MKRFTNSREQNSKLDKVATKIAATILKQQGLFANRLKSLTKSWRQKQQWVFLCGVCLALGGLSLVAMVNSFNKKQLTNQIIPKSINLPKRIYKDVNPLIITDKEFEQVQEYKRSHWDHVKEMPGLFDSLQLIEEQYFSQKK